MPRFYLPADQSKSEPLFLTGREAHHALRVLRLRVGDRVLFRDGNVYVNGQKLAEPYLIPGMSTFPSPEKKEDSFVVGKDQYFVLGDNRRNSADSRAYGAVSRQSILGLIVR